ncbi:hypothetical protein Q9L58_008325 [Maublancomyces gigas]|uniref:Protein kinase domain-containing protein n=1 Tax=Discina gigas TaxID=1032678 RepID=A0ABR3GA04_9PEZI
MPLIGSGIMAPLDARVELAKLLCPSVLLYHAANWIHHDFRSGNVIFALRPPMATSSSASGQVQSEYLFQKCDLSHPLITGFGFARPDNQDECSRALESAKSSRSIFEDVKRYWSPRYMESTHGQGSKWFKQVHDVYALGCVLLEKPLDAFKWRKEYSDDHWKWHTGMPGAVDGSVWDALRRHCRQLFDVG